MGVGVGLDCPHVAHVALSTSTNKRGVVFHPHFISMAHVSESLESPFCSEGASASESKLKDSWNFSPTNQVLGNEED